MRTPNSLLHTLAFITAVGVATSCRGQATDGTKSSTQPAVTGRATPTSMPQGDTKAPRPVQPTSRPTSGPAERSSGDPVVDAILDRLESRGKAIKGLKCEIQYDYVTVVPLEDRQIKKGMLYFTVGKPNPQFLVHFTEKIASDIRDRNHEYYLFDGTWLTERNDRAKTVQRRQVVRKGEEVNLFDLSKGPFPLPFGQKRQRMLELFAVTLKPFMIGDPIRSKHLHCVPRPGTRLADKYTRVEIFVDQQTDIPTKIVTERISDGNRIEVEFKQIDADAAPAGSYFSVGKIPEDYSVTVEALPAEPRIDLTPMN